MVKEPLQLLPDRPTPAEYIQAKRQQEQRVENRKDSGDPNDNDSCHLLVSSLLYFCLPYHNRENKQGILRPKK
jgi:hypothetical protein